MSVQVQTLFPQHKAAFVALMGEAFDQDPLFGMLFATAHTSTRREQQKKAFLEFMFDRAVLLNHALQGVFAGGQLQACALWSRPVQPASAMNQLRLLWRSLALLRVLPFSTLQAMNGYALQTEKHGPRRPHHYLIMVGVHPRAQGQGLGKQLIQQLLQEARQDPVSAGIALDTENPANVPLYQHLGFAVQATPRLQNLTLYCMFRPNPHK